MNDETIFSSLSQIGLLSLIVIVSFLLERSVGKDFERQENNKKEEIYIRDDGLIVGFMSIFAFTISSLLLAGGNISCLFDDFANVHRNIRLIPYFEKFC